VIPTIAIRRRRRWQSSADPIKPPKPDAMDDESAGGGADYDSPRFEHISRTSDDAAMEMVSNAVKDIGGITKSHDNDMKLLQWLWITSRRHCDGAARNGAAASATAAGRRKTEDCRELICGI